MNQLQNFSHQQFGELSIIRINNKDYFGATEVAEALGYANPHDAISKHCLESGVAFHEVTDSMDRTQQKKFITEGNLYRLIVKSRLPAATQFESWVFDDVLPTLRQTGQYGGPRVLSEDEQRIESLKLTLATAEQQRKMQNVLSDHEKQLDELSQKVDEQITLDSGEQRRFQKVVARRVYSITEGKTEAARLFREIHREIKDRFGVASYKDIKRRELLSAIKYIENWIPRKVS
ncbi:BRO family protein [Bacillus amyloliquefaciens]|uniref:Phage antirepressor n=2 Tax=Bacillus TaxID=1386 RepID=A0AAP7TAI8_BACAM|nr:BRO family protein [Bacillus amyloliquefaciens]OIK20275.1 phage antirepressor [Bacillus amyloliquefaciens]